MHVVSELSLSNLFGTDLGYNAMLIFSTDMNRAFGDPIAIANCDSNVLTGGCISVQLPYGPSGVPAPASIWLIGVGLFGLAGIRRRRAKGA